MLYKSLQQTIQEYENRKKETQSEGERKMFKWKVFALGFCIIVIILIGILSQLIQTHQELAQNHNFTFLPTLLHQSSELQDITSIKNFLNGFSKSPRIMFDKSQRILETDKMLSEELLSRIDMKRNIVFLFNLKEQVQEEEPPIVYRFGMLLKTAYDSETDPQDSQINIFDNIEDLSSVYFNLNQPQAMRLNLNPSCRLYSFNQTSKSLILMETIHFAHSSTQDNPNQVHVGIVRQQCFGGSETQALNQIRKITGIQLTSLKQVKKLQVDKIEVFYLTLNGENVQ